MQPVAIGVSRAKSLSAGWLITYTAGCVEFMADVKRLANAAALAWVLICAVALIATINGILPSGETSDVPAAPDYGDWSNWAALPTVYDDGADVLPAWCGVDGQNSAQVDAFYVTPSSPLGSRDNNPTDDFFSNLLQWSALVGQATVFNGVAKVYAPRYRSASQVVQDLDVRFNWRGPAIEVPRTNAAMMLAYEDVEVRRRLKQPGSAPCRT